MWECMHEVVAVVSVATCKTHFSKSTDIDTIHASMSAGTPTISGALQFTRDEEGIDQPGDSPVFTLTCNSGGGPATTVTWRRDGTVVSEDSNHIMTSGLVDQSGLDYTSTLTVTGREDGLYTCTVTNDIGSADGQYQVEGKGHSRFATRVLWITDLLSVSSCWSTH